MSEVTIVCKGVELVVGGSGETESREGGAVWKECNGLCFIPWGLGRWLRKVLAT